MKKSFPFITFWHSESLHWIAGSTEHPVTALGQTPERAVLNLRDLLTSPHPKGEPDLLFQKLGDERPILEARKIRSDDGDTWDVEPNPKTRYQGLIVLENQDPPLSAWQNCPEESRVAVVKELNQMVREWAEGSPEDARTLQCILDLIP